MVAIILKKKSLALVSAALLISFFSGSLTHGLKAQSFAQRARQQQQFKKQQIAKAQAAAAAKAKAEQNRLKAEAKKPPKLPVAPRDPKAVAVVPVNPDRREEALKSAARIDELAEAALTRENQKRNSDSSEYQFVRRVYLDVTGTIPTLAQAKAYLDNRSKEKRSDLIDHLLNSPGYASHMYNYWADVLRLVDRSNNNRYLRPYEDWVKESLRKNTHFDDMVRQMLSSEGRVFDDPATGYMLRDAGMPLDNLNNTVRIFLGTRIGCAQCHDHPFDRWKQKEFYELAAFTGGIQFSKNPEVKMDIPNTEFRDRKYNQLRNVILNNNRQNVWENSRVKLKYPHDYDYPDAKPGEVVKPSVLWGEIPTDVRSMPGRVQFAAWVTSKENTRFARTLANRLWKQVMGLGLIEPVDDMQDDTLATNEELMRFLESEMVRLDFDMKEFLRIVLNSKTYQAQVTYTDLEPGKPYLFSGPVLRRMTPEQVWDSLLTLTIPNPDLVPRPKDDEFVDLVMIRKGEKATDLAVRADQLPEVQKSQRQADDKSIYNPGDIPERILLRRASELPSPLPLGHFLREFGQSDREIISANHTDGTVPQLLELFNGAASHMIIENGSVLDLTLTGNRTANAVADEIFMSILTRHPTTREKRLAYMEANTNGKVGVGNIIWALLNTREFLFIQ